LKVEIFVPCFNEEKNIDPLVDSWSKALKTAKRYELFVTFIDNGSSDSTNNKLKKRIGLFNEKNFKILTKAENTGYGSGIIYGIIKSNADFVGWAHADLQFDPNEVVNKLNETFKKINLNQKILLIGRRKNRSIFDKFFTNFMSYIVWIFTKVYIADINGQPKLFNKDLMDELNNPPDNFNLDLYLILKASKLKYKITRMDINFKNRIFESAKGGGTFIGKIKLSLAVLKYLFNLKFYDKN